MNIINTPGLKWLALSVITTTLLLKIWITPNDLTGLALIGTGLLVYVAVLYLDYWSSYDPNVLWDEQRGFVAIVRPWRVELCAARLLGSVPLGIDLSHSASKVLQAMHTRFQNENGGTLVFFITRPIGNELTKVGMLVRRSALRLPNTRLRLEQLSKLMMADIMILESAMRAAYPHLPVERAEKQDILIVNTGGLQTNVS
ncbi:MAG: hypothetical protein ThorAB25_00170 [Candidatus Thorarchaeota archaeon AB_25]|nr:MAG: hypothetical protein ThorAB25_00170 [Candidatus Thorarchaeota archaeon AB_25]